MVPFLLECLANEDDVIRDGALYTLANLAHMGRETDTESEGQRARDGLREREWDGVSSAAA